MKIIFLDIDGVLNSMKTCEENHLRTGQNGFGGFFREQETLTHDHVLWGQDLVNNLKRIVEETNASIVISSTWRKYYSINKFKEMFAVYGWENAPVIGITDREGPERGREINRYTFSYNIEKYVILDDDSDMLSTQMQNFVNTDPDCGLSEEDAEKAINILNS